MVTHPPDVLARLRGIITVLNTPFTESDAIDADALKRNVEIAIEAGIAGFLVPAMASEVGKLSDKERDVLVAATVTASAGRVSVIGGASADSREARLRYARRCIELGCDGVLASIAYESDAQYSAEVHTLAELNPPFLMLQDWDFHGYGVPVPLIQSLFEAVPAFRCLKIEVVPAGRKYTEVLEATGNQLHVSGGWAVTQMIEALDRGVHAFMPTGMHAIYTRIYSLYHANQRDAARELFEQLLPVLAFSNQHLDISIHFFKRLLHADGVYPTARVREPILPFDIHHERIARELIARAQKLTAAIAENR